MEKGGVNLEKHQKWVFSSEKGEGGLTPKFGANHYRKKGQIS